MSKKIVAINKRGFHGHVELQFEDGSQHVVLQKGQHEHLKVGDYYPAREVERAVDAKASEETLIERESADSGAASEDESGAAREPEARPRSKRK
jgi:hypothetical protein